MRTNLFVIGLVGVLALACAEDAGEPEFDNEVEGESETELEVDDAKADLAGGVYTYYEVTRDVRRCAYPLCGGYWVNRVNANLTRCADGTYQPACYVVELDLVSRMGFRDEEKGQLEDAMWSRTALLRGVVKKKTFETGHTLGWFDAKEAWTAATDAPVSGTYVKVMDNGLRCIAAPCPSYHEAKLNSSAHKNIAGVDLSALNLDEGEQNLARNHTFGGGLIVTGARSYETGPAGSLAARDATQAFFRLIAPEIEPIPPCFVGGCSGQVCSARSDVITTCEWREEYACYGAATCERGADGACGWRATDELRSCLEGAR